jgi:hypothetical protein
LAHCANGLELLLGQHGRGGANEGEEALRGPNAGELSLNLDLALIIVKLVIGGELRLGK